MATVGHALVGLSLAGLSRADSRGGALRHTWPGFMVLMAHLVDVVEWGIILVAPNYFDQHYVTNSPVLTAAVSAVVCLGLAVFARLRSLWAYILVVAAIFSHLLLDNQLLRTFLAEAYGQWNGTEYPSLRQSILGETWLYGLLLICVALVQVSLRRGCPPRGRTVAAILAAVAVLAAITRISAVWMPAYALAAVHVLLLNGRRLAPASAWNLVPPIPVLALLAVELWAGYLYDQAVSLDDKGIYPAAAAMYRRALAVPTRSPKTAACLRLGDCLRRQGMLASAEAALLRARRIPDCPWLAQSKLARFYAHCSVRDTPFFRPDVARQLLLELLAASDPPDVQDYARRLLQQLDKQGCVN